MTFFVVSYWPCIVSYWQGCCVFNFFMISTHTPWISFGLQHTHFNTLYTLFQNSPFLPQKVFELAKKYQFTNSKFAEAGNFVACCRKISHFKDLKLSNTENHIKLGLKYNFCVVISKIFQHTTHFYTNFFVLKHMCIITRQPWR